MTTKACIIKGFEDLYLINSDGSIYSVRKRKLLIPKENNVLYPYLYVCLTGHNGQQLRTGLHRIIALHFIGEQPGPGYEINHKDGDRSNNDISNLEWVTHQQNMVHARQHTTWKPYHRTNFIVSNETRKLMALKKLRKVLLFNDNQEVICESVEKACEYLNTYRRLFNRYANTNKTLNGFRIKVLSKLSHQI